jgi:hypothetical protein
VLRFEAAMYKAKELRGRRSLEHFAKIITRLAAMTDRFATNLDCADTGFLPTAYWMNCRSHPGPGPAASLTST